MNLRLICSASLIATVFACATVAPPAPAHDPTAIAIAAAITARWTGNFQGTQTRSGDAMVSERQRATGTIELIVPRDRPDRLRVRLHLSTRATSAVTSLRWAIYPGNCGSGAPPVVPAETFPTIELSTNGRGSLDQEIAFALATEPRYHVNILHGTGTQLSNVLACANLRRTT